MNTPYELRILLFLGRENAATSADLIDLAHRCGLDEAEMIATAWDLVEVGALTYGADAFFRSTHVE